MLQQRLLQLRPEGLYTAETGPQPLHFYLPGLYLRVLTLPKGSRTIGKIHRHAHAMLVLAGEAAVAGDGEPRVVRAGDQFESPAGAKRAVYCFEDTTFMTVHRNETNTQDLDEIEAEHIEPEDPATAALLASLNQGALHDLGSIGGGGGEPRLQHGRGQERPPGAAAPAAEPTGGGG